MTTRYMVTYDIPSERPKTGCVLHDDKQNFRIVVGDPEEDEDRTLAAQQMVPDLLQNAPNATIEDALSTFLLKSGYATGSNWGDSPYSYEETIQRLTNELRTILFGASLERNARLMNVVRAGTETGVDLDPDDENSMAILLDASGERERMATPGLGYPVPEEARKRQIIEELLGLEEAGGGEPTVVIVPNTEEVFSEREDVQGSEEGS